MVGIHYAEGYAPPDRLEGTYERRAGALRASVSAGSLRRDGADSGRAATAGSEYLQKLPPVLRRSVTGTGARQHAARNMFASPSVGGESDARELAGSRHAALWGGGTS